MKSALFLIFLSSLAAAQTLSDSVVSVGSSTVAISTELADLSSHASDMINKYKMTNASQCALVVIGLSSTNSVPMYFIPGPDPVAGLQADIMDVDSMSVTNIATGPEALADGKQVSFARIQGGTRMVLFGLNQTPLHAGNIAILQLDTSQAIVGPHVLSPVNLVLSTADGTLVPSCATSGVITK